MVGSRPFRSRSQVRRRRRFPVRSRYTKRRALAMSRVALSRVNRLQNAVETKFKYTFLDDDPASLSWQIIRVHAVAQGDGSDQRVGDSIKPISLQVKVKMDHGSATTSSFDCRIIVLRGKNEQGDGLTKYIGAYNDGTAAPNMLKYKAEDQMYSSRTLYDRQFHVVGGNYDTNSNQKYSMINVKLGGYTNFENAAIDVADGGIYILYVSNLTAATNLLSLHCKLKYTDS